MWVPNRTLSTCVPSPHRFGRFEPPRAGPQGHLDSLPCHCGRFRPQEGSFTRNALSQTPSGYELSGHSSRVVADPALSKARVAGKAVCRLWFRDYLSDVGNLVVFLGVAMGTGLA